MSDEIVVFPIGGFLLRGLFWAGVGTFLLCIDGSWFAHRHEVPVLVWLPWTIGLAVVSAGPYFLAYRSIRRGFHYFWLRQKFNYGMKR